MPKKTLNWDKIKQQYFNSDIEEVTDFLQTFYRLENKSYYRQKTKGWRDEKKEFRAKITAKAQEKIINNVDVLNSTELLIKGKQLIINSILKRVQENNKSLTMNELATALDKVKIELGEPTKIDKSEMNLNTIAIKDIIDELVSDD